MFLFSLIIIFNSRTITLFLMQQIKFANIVLQIVFLLNDKMIAVAGYASVDQWLFTGYGNGDVYWNIEPFIYRHAICSGHRVSRLETNIIDTNKALFYITPNLCSLLSNKPWNIIKSLYWNQKNNFKRSTTNYPRIIHFKIHYIIQIWKLYLTRTYSGLFATGIINLHVFKLYYFYIPNLTLATKMYLYYLIFTFTCSFPNTNIQRYYWTEIAKLSAFIPKRVPLQDN